MRRYYKLNERGFATLLPSRRLSWRPSKAPTALILEQLNDTPLTCGPFNVMITTDYKIHVKLFANVM